MKGNDQQTPGDYATLRLFAEMFYDAQECRKAMANKVRSGSVDPILASAMDHYEAAEKMFSDALKRAMRRTANPGILAWQKEQNGIGEHLLGRLLGAIGTPRVATPKHWEGRGKDNRVLVETEPRPRTIAQLWSYCGHGDPARKLHRGIGADELMALGSPRTKAIVWNIACACLKAGVRTDELGNHKAISHYGDVYLNRRYLTEDRVHASECVRCGPSGKPAPAGSPWSNAHKHADALRIVGKEVLRDLWKAAGE